MNFFILHFYETQLDGFELNEISRETDKDIKHIYFIDDYNTWWNIGRSSQRTFIKTTTVE